MKTPITEETLHQFSAFIAKKQKIQGKFVIQSKKSHKDVTYKVSAFVSKRYGYSVFIGYESSYNDFISCCFLASGKVYMTKRFQDTESNVVKGAKWILERIVNKEFSLLLDQCYVYHTGNCIKCNKELTDAESIEYGIGPVCRSY